MRRAVTTAVLAAVLVTTFAVGTARPAAAATELPTVRRVLVISVPGVTWQDIRDNHLRNLRALTAESAVANLSVRVRKLKSEVGDGYATMSSGTRAVANRDDAGLAFEGDEQFEADDAADAYERINNRRFTGVAAHLRLPELKIANVKSLFRAKLAVLGDALAAAGVQRGIVANADAPDVRGELTSFHREALIAMMARDGQVPCGAVGDELQAKDPAAPFGIALDDGAVVAAARKCLEGRSVVLVEGSDLRRAELYAPRVSGARFDQLWHDALVRTDRLVGELLRTVDPARDAVVLVAPAAPQTTVPQLTVFSVRAPQLSPGLLESGVTRQAGFASIVDVAPTIAQLAGAHLKEGDLEGRPVSIGRRGGDSGARLHFMIEENDAAQYRDRIVALVMSVFIVTVLLLALVATIALSTRRRWRLLEPLALATLASLPMTYWAGLLPFHRWGTPAYLAFVLGGGLVVGFLADLARRRFGAPLVIVLSIMLLTIATSVVLLGSRLQLSTVFGDSPIVAGRFAGINNVTFAQLMVAAILLAGFITLASKPNAKWWVAVLFVAVLLVDGAPMWGADVGGVLSGVTALALTYTLLAGWRVRFRTVVVWVAATLGVIVALGLLDLTRDPSHRTHLGRLFENIGSDGSSGFTTVVHRKLESNVATLTSSVWRWVFVPIGLLAAFVIVKVPERVSALRRRMPPLDACLIGIATAAVLGYALNDSGIAVPGVMVGVLAPALVYLLNGTDPA